MNALTVTLIGIRTTVMSVLALVAFAGNSVLCRIALSDGAIHPASFTSVRLVSGALTLFLLVWLLSFGEKSSNSHAENNWLKKGWAAPSMLFVYAVLFSFAYITLDTGVGALILFGSVQITMVTISMARGGYLTLPEWLGLLLASAGLFYLVFPELSKPSIFGFAMMSFAGVAWGIYTVLGQGSQNPLADTASNFIKTIPFIVVLIAFFSEQILSVNFQDDSVVLAWLLAVLSGALTSGVGYAIWYSALRNLKPSQAGVVQLLVPIIAALGGVLFAGELLTSRLVISSILTLGGILIFIRAKKRVA